MDYTHSDGFSAKKNGYAIGPKGSEVEVISSTGLHRKVPWTVTVSVEDLNAGADIANRIIFQVPSYHRIVINTIDVIALGAAEGVDADDTCVVTVDNGEDAVATRTYNAVVPFPEAATPGSLVVDSNHNTVGPGEKLRLQVTNGDTANPPAFLLQINGTIEALKI